MREEGEGEGEGRREREREREGFLTLALGDLASIKILSPIFSPKVAMVTSSVDGESACEEPCEWVETVDTGDLVPVSRG